jgi:hypothetical protein
MTIKDIVSENSIYFIHKGNVKELNPKKRYKNNKNNKNNENNEK